MSSLISRLGLAISRAFERTAPDPFVIAVLLSVLTAGLALGLGRYPSADAGVWDRAEHLLDAWRFEEVRDGVEVGPGRRLGLWKLLEFAMQMCLILVTGHALATTVAARRAIAALARIPRRTAGAAAMIGLIACLTALINWGLGLIVGALLAREVARGMSRRGIRTHYPLLAAAGYMGLMVWHGGLSGSAPLSMTSRAAAAKVLPGSSIDLLDQWARQSGAAQYDGTGLQQTLLSPLNLFVTLGLLVLVPVLFMLLAPTRNEDHRDVGDFMLPAGDDGDGSLPVAVTRSLPDRLERSWVIVWLLALPLILGLARFAQTRGLGAVGLNEINAAMLALGLVLHGSARSYVAAVEQGARGCAGIIIQFPLYAGIMAMMQASGLVAVLAECFTDVGSGRTIPLLSFVAASVINLFVPSGGGQWAVQGPVALQAGLDAGIEPGKIIMAVAYGDQLTNMLQPFWALPLLAITGVKARDIVGYTALVMLVAAAWIALGLLLF